MDKFVKLRKIGEGSFGKAFLVKSKNDGGQYVVKEIGILKMNSKEREESRKEVAVLAQLNHPNIVAYRQSFEEHGSLYIVMDYCAGGDLFTRISAQRGILFNENQVLDWLVQICLALKHIHDRKILHRDIKSQNIFLTTTGKVRLGDFGIAKVLNSTVELARTCIGTPYYLSPEICENKPYNNKSDVWSLGCVLYELATLKHPFESGNMKNLVLKIIRGSYPPVHCKYSYEMRNLIAQLFKRSPRDRPSINSILKKPFLRPRIQKFLSDAEYSEEFSHTVMHGMKIEKRLIPPPGMGGRPPAVARPPSAGKLRPSPSPRYDPAQVYGKPLVRKSRENNREIKDIKKRPGSAENRRPLPLGPSASLEKRRQELIAKEKKRQDEARKKQYEKRHQELLDKQKMARINRAREDGWSNLLGAGDSGDKPNDLNKEKPRLAEAPKQKLNWPGPKNNSNDDGRGKYEHYNAYLDQLQSDRENRAAGLEKLDYMNAGPVAAPSSMMGIEPSRVQEEHQRIIYNPAQHAVRQAEENRVKAGEAAERAKLVEDFLYRKKQAAMNKARGNADLMGRPNPAPLQRPPAGKAKPSAGPFAARNREEQEYLQNLRKIRLQNFNERHKLQNKVDHSASQEERKRKINALREQADQRAHHLKVNLEREAFERKLKLMENQRQNAPPSPRDPMKFAKPAVAAPMTKILQQIGVVQVKSGEQKNTEQTDPMKFAQPPSMTKVLQQIGVVSDNSVPVIPEEDKNTEQSLKEKQAEAIKKNLQENPPEAARTAWGSPSATPIIEQPDSARSQWGAEHQTLSALPLEQSTSQQPDDSAVEEPLSARRQWGGQAGTVLNVLKDVKISSATVTLPEDESRGERPEIIVSQGEGRLFDKVHLFEEDGEMVERHTKKVTPIGKTVTLQPLEEQIKEKLNKSGLLAGLSTGSFDAPNIQILRTCSEPNLAKLFKTIVEENSFSNHAKPSKSLELGADEMEEDEEEIIGVEDIVTSEDQEATEEEVVCVDIENEEEQADEAGQEEQDEDEDFRTVRESMASLLTLTNDDDDDKTDEGATVAFSLTDDSDTVNSSDKTNEDKTDKGDTIKSDATDAKIDSDNAIKVVENSEDTNGNGESKIIIDEQMSDDIDDSNLILGENKADECNIDDDDTEEIDDDTEEIDDDETMDEDCKLDDDQIIDISHDISSEAEYVDAVDHPRGLPTSYSQLFLSDESEEDEDDEDEYDVFSNLEESRMELERDLGCDKFLKAYKAVQAVHEDEDEDLEAGTKIALNILGSNQEHLYPKIFQLVMADTAFTEDNS